MDDWFQEIQDSHRKRSGGSQTFIKDGQLFANEKVLRGYQDWQISYGVVLKLFPVVLL